MQITSEVLCSRILKNADALNEFTVEKGKGIPVADIIFTSTVTMVGLYISYGLLRIAEALEANREIYK